MKVLRSVVAAILLPAAAAVAQDSRSLPKEIEASGGEVKATGRWVRAARANSDAPLLARLNSVKIVCVKERGVCQEAVALLYTGEDVPQMSGSFLTALLAEYKITRWDASGITAVAALPVADVEIQIDLKAGTARRRHQETKARSNRTANPNLIVVWELE